MKEVLLNRYLKIEPLESQGFVSSSKDTYEEIGKVVAKDDTVDIPLGAMVFFDSFMAKKYPLPENPLKFQWYIHYDEIVKYETNAD